MQHDREITREAPPPLPPFFFRRLVDALLLRRALYDGVAGESTATGQAAAVVCLSALAQRTVLIDEFGAWALPLVMIFGVVRWCLFTAIAYRT